MRGKAVLLLGWVPICLLIAPMTSGWYKPYVSAKKAIQERRWGDAVAKLTEAIENEPSAARWKRGEGNFRTEYFPYYYLGIAYKELGELEKADEAFRKALAHGQLPKGLVAIAQRKLDEIRAPTPAPDGSQTSPEARSTGSNPLAPLVYRPGGKALLSDIEPYEKSYAVVIGVTQYESLPDLPGAVPDAVTVAEALEKRGFQTIRLLDGEATRSNIAALLGDRLPYELGHNDRVFVYFAGHGVTVGVGDYAMGYLMPTEGDNVNRVSTGISMTELQRWFSAYPSKHVMFVADACYSGLALSARSPSVAAPANDDSWVLADYWRQVTQSSVRLAITAGRDNQEAHEYRGHGLFTYFFLEALEGAADTNGDGILTSSELYAYIEPNVAQTALANWRAQQNPQMGKTGQGEFIFMVPDRK